MWLEVQQSWRDRVVYELRVVLLPYENLDNLLAAVNTRVNDAWKHLSDIAQSMVIFRGAESYITPSWYPSGGPRTYEVEEPRRARCFPCPPGHLTIPVSDLGRSKAWYPSVLGLRVEIEGPDRAAIALQDCGGSTLFVAQQSTFSGHPTCVLTAANGLR